MEKNDLEQPELMWKDKIYDKNEEYNTMYPMMPFIFKRDLFVSIYKKINGKT